MLVNAWHLRLRNGLDDSFIVIQTNANIKGILRYSRNTLIDQNDYFAVQNSINDIIAKKNTSFLDYGFSGDWTISVKFYGKMPKVDFDFAQRIFSDD